MYDSITVLFSTRISDDLPTYTKYEYISPYPFLRYNETISLDG